MPGDQVNLNLDHFARLLWRQSFYIKSPTFNPPDFWFGHNTHPKNFFSGRHFGIMAAGPVYVEASERSDESEFLVQDDISDERSGSNFAERSGSSRIARLGYIDLKEEILC